MEGDRSGDMNGETKDKRRKRRRKRHEQEQGQGQAIYSGWSAQCLKFLYQTDLKLSEPSYGRMRTGREEEEEKRKRRKGGEGRRRKEGREGEKREESVNQESSVIRKKERSKTTEGRSY